MRLHHYLLVVLLGVSSAAMATERYVEVVGQGRLEVAPDFIKISLQVSDVQASTSTAKTNVDASINEVLAVAREAGIRTLDIDAARISNQPVYEWKNNTRVFKGEQVSRPVVLTLRDLSQHTTLVNSLLKIKLVNLHNTQMGFNDRAALEQKAMLSALQQAQSKATAMADAMNSKLGKVLRISEQGSHVPMMEARMMAARADDSSAPMLVQKQTVEASALVRFELK